MLILFCEILYTAKKMFKIVYHNAIRFVIIIIIIIIIISLIRQLTKRNRDNE